MRSLIESMTGLTRRVGCTILENLTMTRVGDWTIIIRISKNIADWQSMYIADFHSRSRKLGDQHSNTKPFDFLRPTPLYLNVFFLEFPSIMTSLYIYTVWITYYLFLTASFSTCLLSVVRISLLGFSCYSVFVFFVFFLCFSIFCFFFNFLFVFPIVHFPWFYDYGTLTLF